MQRLSSEIKLRGAYCVSMNYIVAQSNILSGVHTIVLGMWMDIGMAIRVG